MLFKLNLAFRTELNLLAGLYTEVENLKMNQEHQFQKTMAQATGSNQSLSSTKEAKDNMGKLMQYEKDFRASFKKLQIVTGENLTSIYPALSTQQGRSYQLATAFRTLLSAADWDW